MTPWDLWVWPWKSSLEMFRRALELTSPPSGLPENAEATHEEPEWTTPHRIVLDLAELRLLDFSSGARKDEAVLVVAPFALHDAAIADLAPGHSLIQTLRSGGCSELFLIEWKSATDQTRMNTIDALLSALNIAVDEIGGRVSLVGLCQGGWLSLVYALRFPSKIRRLALAGAPIDTSASDSHASFAARSASIPFIEELILRGNGRVLGRQSAALWPRETDESSRVIASLQLEGSPEGEINRELVEKFRRWDRRTLDLPGPYYLQVFHWLYCENRLATGAFVALGRKLAIERLQCPLFLLAGEGDVIAPPPQAFAAAAPLAGGKNAVETALAPCGHLALFLGRRTLTQHWPRIAKWLKE
jgi:poly(3-hydroxyalkanoate) synthetase